MGVRKNFKLFKYEHFTSNWHNAKVPRHQYEVILRAFIDVETTALTFRTKQPVIAVISVTANDSITISFQITIQ